MIEHDSSCGPGDDEKVYHDVKTYGWHVVNILELPNTPGWSFSIGFFQTFSHPEVVVFGLNNGLNQSVINSIGEDLRAGVVHKVDEPYGELIEGFDCVLKPVRPIWYRDFLGYANWFYKGPHYPALQCIWPDKNARFPWDKDFNPNWLFAQPLLYEDDATAARAVEIIKTLNEP